MSGPDNNARPLSSKPRAELSAAALERLCWIDPHPSKTEGMRDPAPESSTAFLRVACRDGRPPSNS
jgi:hypothetical protein